MVHMARMVRVVRLRLRARESLRDGLEDATRLRAQPMVVRMLREVSERRQAAGVDDGSVMMFETPNTRQSAEQRRGTIDEEDEEDEMEAEDERTED